MKRLKEILAQRGIKQKWLAEQIGVSEVTISNWVKGVFQPTNENIQKIIEVLNIDKEELHGK